MSSTLRRRITGGTIPIVPPAEPPPQVIRNIIDQIIPSGSPTVPPPTPPPTPIPQPGSTLMIPGGVGSTIDWGNIIRDWIDKQFFSGDDNGGVTGPPAVIPPPIDPGLMTPIPGTFPVLGCAPRPKVQYIALPDGTVGCPSGYHPEKSGKGYCVRNRRMNPLNPRALARAGRRVGGFARAVKRARTLKQVCRSL